LQVFFAIAYFLIGLIQFFAVWSGVQYGLEIGDIFSFIIAVIVTYIPILGSALGVYGAYNVWDWELWQAFALFFWYVPVFILFLLVGLVSDR